MGTLYLVATPIGNREDITIRALVTLFSVDIILCEDTRHTGQLLSYYRKSISTLRKSHDSNADTIEIKSTLFSQMIDDYQEIRPPARLISYYDEIEQQRVPEIVELLKNGRDVALVSDAGTPLIADPGFKIVRECHRLGIPVSPIPGASSILAALSASGLPADSFAFLGYVPKKQTKKSQFFEKVREFRSIGGVKTVILFETSQRIHNTIKALTAFIQPEKIVIAREITKMNEQVLSLKHFQKLPHADTTKGEYVILVSSKS